MHGRGKTATAPASDAATRKRRCCLRVGAASFFFFSVSHRLGIDLGRFALNRADLRPLGPYQAKSLIQAEIQRLLRAVSIRNSLFFIFFFFASLSSSSPDLTPFFFFFFASSSSSLLRLLEWVLFYFFFSIFLKSSVSFDKNNLKA